MTLFWRLPFLPRWAIHMAVILLERSWRDRRTQLMLTSWACLGSQSFSKGRCLRVGAIWVTQRMATTFTSWVVKTWIMVFTILCGASTYKLWGTILRTRGGSKSTLAVRWLKTSRTAPYSFTSTKYLSLEGLAMNRLSKRHLTTRRRIEQT